MTAGAPLAEEQKEEDRKEARGREKMRSAGHRGGLNVVPFEGEREKERTCKAHTNALRERSMMDP